MEVKFQPEGQAPVEERLSISKGMYEQVQAGETIGSII